MLSYYGELYLYSTNKVLQSYHEPIKALYRHFSCSEEKQNAQGNVRKSLNTYIRKSFVSALYHKLIMKKQSLDQMSESLKSLGAEILKAQAIKYPIEFQFDIPKGLPHDLKIKDEECKSQECLEKKLQEYIEEKWKEHGIQIEKLEHTNVSLKQYFNLLKWIASDQENENEIVNNFADKLWKKYNMPTSEKQKRSLNEMFTVVSKKKSPIESKINTELDCLEYKLKDGNNLYEVDLYCGLLDANDLDWQYL